MFRKYAALITLSIAVSFASAGHVHAQVLGGNNSNSTEITVGTTTRVQFDGPTFQSAQTTIQNILFYLRNGFGFEDVDANPIAIPTVTEELETGEDPVTVSPSSSYTDIVDIAFLTDQLPPTSSIGSLGGGSCFTFVGSFELGDEGPEILEIQKFLNSDPETQIAAEGVGSAGEETEFFGARTDAAVRAFQAKYYQEILNPIGLFQPTGFWGASSRAKANELYGCDS